MSLDSSSPDNLLLAMLPAADRAVIDRCLEAVDLPTGLVLYEPHEPVGHAYFPAAGMISIVSSMDRGTVEVVRWDGRGCWASRS